MERRKEDGLENLYGKVERKNGGRITKGEHHDYFDYNSVYFFGPVPKRLVYTFGPSRGVK